MYNITGFLSFFTVILFILVIIICTILALTQPIFIILALIGVLGLIISLKIGFDKK